MKKYKTPLITALLLIAGTLSSCTVSDSSAALKDSADNTSTAINTETPSDIVGNNTEENNQKVCTEELICFFEGVWADLQSSSVSGDMALFEFFSFTNGVMYPAHSHGHVGRKGEIVKAVELADSLYQITVFYPVVDDLMNGYLEETTTVYEIKVIDNSFFFVNTPEYIYTYMGKDFDSAYKAVFDYCNAVNNHQNYSAPNNKVEHQYSAVALEGAIIIEVNSTTKTLKYKKKCESCGFVDNSTYSCNIPSSGTTNSSFLCTKCKKVQPITIQGSVKIIR